jgi:hypothetical protein
MLCTEMRNAQNHLHLRVNIQELARQLNLPIPESLSQIEEMLIAKVRVMMLVYSVKGR